MKSEKKNLLNGKKLGSFVLWIRKVTYAKRGTTAYTGQRTNVITYLPNKEIDWKTLVRFAWRQKIGQFRTFDLQGYLCKKGYPVYIVMVVHVAKAKH